MKSFANRLRELRKNKGVYQKEMALLLDITERQYQRYEKGDIDLPTSKLCIIAEYFNVSTDYLLTGKGDEPVRVDFRESIYGRINALSAKSRNDLEEYLTFLEMRDKPTRK